MMQLPVYHSNAVVPKKEILPQERRTLMPNKRQASCFNSGPGTRVQLSSDVYEEDRMDSPPRNPA